MVTIFEGGSSGGGGEGGGGDSYGSCNASLKPPQNGASICSKQDQNTDAILVCTCVRVCVWGGGGGGVEGGGNFIIEEALGWGGGEGVGAFSRLL